MVDPSTADTTRLLSLLRASAKLILVLIVGGGTSNLLIGGMVGSSRTEMLGGTATPLPVWAFPLSLVASVILISVYLRFALPLVRGTKSGRVLLESSLLRLATLWRVLSALTLLGLLGGAALVAWIFFDLAP